MFSAVEFTIVFFQENHLDMGICKNLNLHWLK